MAPAIRCVSSYSEGGQRFEAGKSYDFREDEAARLVRGSPASWDYDPAQVRIGGPSELVNYSEPASMPRGRRTGDAKTNTAAAQINRDDEDEDGEDEGDDLDDLTIGQLRELAAARDVDITGLRSKLEIRNAIERAEVTEGDPRGDAGDDQGGEE